MDAELKADLVGDDSDDNSDDNASLDDSSGEESDSGNEETMKTTYENNERYLQTGLDNGEEVDGNVICNQLTLAYKLYDLDKVIDTLMLAFLFTQLMTNTNLWLLHFDEIFPLITSREHVKKLIELYKQGLKLFFSVDVALKLSTLVNSNHCTDAQSNEIWEILIPAYGFCVLPNIHLLWRSYITDIIRREPPDSPEKSQLIFLKYKEALTIPSKGMEMIFTDFENFCTTHSGMLATFDLKTIRKECENTNRKLPIFEKFEEDLAVGRNAIDENEDNKKINQSDRQLRRGLLEKDILSYCDNYITFCSSDITLPVEITLSLYERMTTDKVCHTFVSIWKTYMNFLLNLIGSDHNIKYNFNKNISDVINRGMKRSLLIQKTIQSSILNALIYCNDTPQINFKEIIQVATQRDAYDGEELVSNIIVAYLNCHAVSQEKLKELFSKSWNFYVAIFEERRGNSETEQKLRERVTSHLATRKRKSIVIDKASSSKKK